MQSNVPAQHQTIPAPETRQLTFEPPNFPCTKLSDVSPKAWQVWLRSRRKFGEISPLPMEYPPKWLTPTELDTFYSPLHDRGWWIQKRTSPGYPSANKIYSSSSIQNLYFIEDDADRQEFCRAIPSLITEEKPFDLGYYIAYHSDGLVDIFLDSPNAIHPSRGVYPGLTLADLRAAYRIECLLRDEYTPHLSRARPWRGPLTVLPGNASYWIKRFADPPPTSLNKSFAYGTLVPLDSMQPIPEPPPYKELEEFSNEHLASHFAPLHSRGWVLRFTSQPWHRLDPETGKMEVFHTKALCLMKCITFQDNIGDFNDVLALVFGGVGKPDRLHQKTRITFGDRRIIVTLFTKSLKTTIQPFDEISSVSTEDIARAIQLEHLLCKIPALQPYHPSHPEFINKTAIGSMMRSMQAKTESRNGDLLPPRETGTSIGRKFNKGQRESFWKELVGEDFRTTLSGRYKNRRT